MCPLLLGVPTRVLEQPSKVEKPKVQSLWKAAFPKLPGLHAWKISGLCSFCKQAAKEPPRHLQI